MIIKFKNPVDVLGRWVTLRFDTFSWFVMCEINQIEFHEMHKLPENKFILTLMYGAYVSACRFAGKRERYQITDFYKIWQKLKVEDVEKIKTAIINSRVLGKSVSEWAADEGEKKK